MTPSDQSLYCLTLAVCDFVMVGNNTDIEKQIKNFSKCMPGFVIVAESRIDAAQLIFLCVKDLPDTEAHTHTHTHPTRKYYTNTKD